MSTFWKIPGEALSFWDQMYLGDRVWPGAWTVQIEKGRSVDKPKANGKDGYSLANKGYTGAPFKATGRIWTEEQQNNLESFISKYDPEFSKIAEPLDIYHPICELLLLSQVFISKITMTQPAPGALWLTVGVEMDQWFPAEKIKKAKPVGFDGTSLAGSPINPADFEIGPPRL